MGCVGSSQTRAPSAASNASLIPQVGSMHSKSVTGSAASGSKESGTARMANPRLGASVDGMGAFWFLVGSERLTRPADHANVSLGAWSRNRARNLAADYENRTHRTQPFDPSRPVLKTGACTSTAKPAAGSLTDSRDRVGVGRPLSPSGLTGAGIPFARVDSAECEIWEGWQDKGGTLRS